MKIVLWLLLCLALPVAASANSVDFTNSGGTLSGSTAGLSLSGSTLIAINAGTLLTGDLGTITFSTGALNQRIVVRAIGQRNQIPGDRTSE